MKIIKSSQQDVFSEYLKIMSKFNEKRSINKTASALSALKVVDDIAEATLRTLNVTQDSLRTMDLNAVLKLDGFEDLVTSSGSHVKALEAIYSPAKVADEISSTTDRIIAVAGGDYGRLLKNLQGEELFERSIKFEKDMAKTGDINRSFDEFADSLLDSKRVADGEVGKVDVAGFKLDLAKTYAAENIEKLDTKILSELGLESADELTVLKSAMESTEPLSNAQKIVANKYLAKVGEGDSLLKAKVAPDAAKATDETTEAVSETAGEASGTRTETGPIREVDTVTETKTVTETVSESPVVNKVGEDTLNTTRQTADGKTMAQVGEELSQGVSDVTNDLNKIASKGDSVTDNEVMQTLDKIVKLLETQSATKADLSKVNTNIQKQLSGMTEELSERVKAVANNLGDNQAKSLERSAQNLEAALAKQSAEVQLMVKTEVETITKSLGEGGDALATAKQMEELSKKIDELGEGASKEDVQKLIDQITDVEGPLKKAGNFISETSSTVKKKFIEHTDKIVDLKIKGIVYAIFGLGAVALAGYGIYELFKRMSNHQPTPLPTMMNNQQAQNIAAKMNQIMLPQYLQGVADCLQNKEKYQAGTTSDRMAKNLLQQVNQTIVAMNSFTQNPTIQTMTTYSNEADRLIVNLSAFGLKAGDRQSELDTANSNLNDLRNCIQNQGQSVSKLQDVSNDINALSLAQQSLQMAQQGGQAGQGMQQMQQGTTIAPGAQTQQPAPAPAPRQNPIYSQDVTLTIDGVAVQFNLADYNLYPTNYTTAPADYQSLLQGGSMKSKLEDSLTSKTRGVQDPARLKVERYMFSSPSLPRGVTTLQNLVGLAGQGDPNAMDTLKYALARHVASLLSKGGRDQYKGMFGGRFKRRKELGRGFQLFDRSRVDDLRRAKKEKNKDIIKQSANNESYGDLKKLSDDFSKRYYKDAVKDLNGNDSLIKEFYKSYGEFYEYKREANDQKLYGLSENDTNLLSEAHPETATVADARGKGGLVENSHEQHEAMKKMFGDKPTANFKGSYARLKQQMKKRGY